MRVLLLGAAAVFFSGCARYRMPGIVRPARASAETVIANVDVFDGETTRRSQDVVLRGGLVAALGPAGSVPLPARVERIDGTGRTLLPGLIDSHVHLTTLGVPPWKHTLPHAEDGAHALLSAGVTTALVAWNGDPEAKLARAAAEGAVLAPRFYLAGNGLASPGAHPIPLIKALAPWPFDRLLIKRQPQAATPEEARAAVDAAAKDDPTPFFKIFYDSLPEGSPHMSKEVLRAAVAEAKARGLRPIVHTGAAQDMVDAAEAGASIIMHVAYEDRLGEEQIAKIKASGVPCVTTLRIFSAAKALNLGRPTAYERRVSDPALLRDFASRPAGWRMNFGDVEERSDAYVANQRFNVQALARAGVTLLAGTDTGVPGVLPGAALHAELGELVALGFTPADALKAATSVPAEILDPSRSYGRVAAGRRADLLLVRGDPTADITALDEIEAVFLGGERLAPAVAF